MSGTCVRVAGVGILLTGPSGIGKSETALALVSRGHRFVADDVACLYVDPRGRIRATGMMAGHPVIEVRGLGVLDIARLYGPRAVARESGLDLVVELVPYRRFRTLDPLKGIEPVTILGCEVAGVRIPVSPGRSLPILVEAASRLLRLHRRGIDPSRGFGRRLERMLKGGTKG